jgi:hypothetical protein
VGDAVAEHRNGGLRGRSRHDGETRNRNQWQRGKSHEVALSSKTDRDCCTARTDSPNHGFDSPADRRDSQRLGFTDFFTRGPEQERNPEHQFAVKGEHRVD